MVALVAGLVVALGLRSTLGGPLDDARVVSGTPVTLTYAEPSSPHDQAQNVAQPNSVTTSGLC